MNCTAFQKQSVSADALLSSSNLIIGGETIVEKEFGTSGAAFSIGEEGNPFKHSYTSFRLKSDKFPSAYKIVFEPGLPPAACSELIPFSMLGLKIYPLSFKNNMFEIGVGEPAIAAGPEGTQSPLAYGTLEIYAVNVKEQWARARFFYMEVYWETEEGTVHYEQKTKLIEFYLSMHVGETQLVGSCDGTRGEGFYLSKITPNGVAVFAHFGRVFKFTNNVPLGNNPDWGVSLEWDGDRFRQIQFTRDDKVCVPK